MVTGLSLRLTLLLPILTFVYLAEPLASQPVAFADATTTVNCAVDTTHLAPDAEEQAVLDQANAYRASYGLPALRPSYALTQDALWKSGDMATRAYVEHDDGFRNWAQRFADCGYPTPGAYLGENLAAGNAAGGVTLVQWEASPPHNANLLDPHFTAIGIKRVQAPNPADLYHWYWAMELGSGLDYDLTAWLAGK